YGRTLKDITRNDASRDGLSELDIHLLEAHEQLKLMAETGKIWRNVTLILENFEETNISKDISRVMEAVKTQELTEEQKDRIHLVLLKRLESIQRPASPSCPPPPYSSVQGERKRV
ncbi:hypothetical protein PMAYCL1PPCAC_19990, partial [Pristionchus mayeri]